MCNKALMTTVKKLFNFFLLIISVGLMSAFSFGGKGENTTTIQSGFNGSYYVKTIPDEDFGNKGVTRVYSVKRDVDELIDEYPIFMRGELFLGWSPIEGQWCLVHAEPERITSSNDYDKIGQIESLNFYMGGKLLRSYSGSELRNMGLSDHVDHLTYMVTGQFVIKGIEQIPLTNHYVFKIKMVASSTEIKDALLDITNGELFNIE